MTKKDQKDKEKTIDKLVDTVNSKPNVFSLKRRAEDVLKLEFEDGFTIEWVDSRRWAGKDFAKFNQKNKAIQKQLNESGFGNDPDAPELTEDEAVERAEELEKLLDSALRMLLPGIEPERIKEIGGIVEKAEAIAWFNEEYAKKKQRG